MEKDGVYFSFTTQLDIFSDTDDQHTQVTISAEDEPALIRRIDLGPERLRAGGIVGQFSVEIAKSRVLLNVLRRESQGPSVCLRPIKGEIYLTPNDPEKDTARLDNDLNITGLSVGITGFEEGDLYIHPAEWARE